MLASSKRATLRMSVIMYCRCDRGFWSRMWLAVKAEMIVNRIIQMLIAFLAVNVVFLSILDWLIVNKPSCDGLVVVWLM